MSDTQDAKFSKLKLAIIFCFVVVHQLHTFLLKTVDVEVFYCFTRSTICVKNVRKHSMITSTRLCTNAETIACKFMN